MSRWLDVKYTNMLSTYVRNFKRKSPNLWNFSCPFCGDSLKDKRKARGYCYPIKDKLVYHCHNCGVTKGIKQLLMEVNSSLYDDYYQETLTEKAQEKKDHDEFVFTQPKFINNDNLKKLSKISQLSSIHHAKKYVVSRLIPTKFHAKLYFCPEFKSWTNSFIPDKFEDIYQDEERLIIPLFDKNLDMIGYQGRSFDPDAKIRYITIMLDESKPRIFNLDEIDFTKRSYMTEGPIDSMFLLNAGASGGGEIIAELNRIPGINKELITVVYDNESRNRDTVKRMRKAINNGYSICIWPEDINEKDIALMVAKRCIIQKDYVNNDYVMKNAGIIQDIINKNTYHGMTALIKLNEWKKIDDR